MNDQQDAYYYDAYPGYPGTIPPVQYPAEKKTDGFAIASLACSLGSLCIGGTIVALLGIIFGFISLKRIKDKPHELKGKGMAVAGLICGSVILVISVIIIGIYFAMIVAATSFTP